MKLKTLITTGVLAAALSLAQGPRGGGRPGPPNGTAPDPAQMVAQRVNMLARMLDLADDQRAQATRIFTDAQTASAAARTAMQTGRTNLTAAIKANNTANIDGAAQAIGTATTQLTSIEAKADAAFYLILTADQKAKYDQMRGGRGGMMMGPGPQGMGGGPRGAGRRAPNQ